LVVGRLHRGANLAKESQALVDGEAVLVAVAVDRAALDVLHDDEWEPVVGGAGVQQPRDVGMIEAGELLALGVEPAARGVAGHSPFEHLDRGPARRSAVAPREVHGAGASSGDWLSNSPLTESLALEVGRHLPFVVAGLR